MSTAAIIVAAGSGSRMSKDLPKQFMKLGDRSVLAHSYARLKKYGAIGPVAVVIGAGQEALSRSALGDGAMLVTGGATRRESVRAGLEALAALGGVERVLIHDAARPLLPAAVIDRLLDALKHGTGAIPVLPVVDTLARVEGARISDGVERSGIVQVQTPQAFAFDAVLAVHRQWNGATEPTDDASMVRAGGHDVIAVEGDTMLGKITHAQDLERAERDLGISIPRVGTGYDVHRLVPGKPLWLCGVQVPHDRGLSGHSDADVAIHALVDALLGALAEGDIGSHFPPSDPQWKDAPSARFLEFARERVSARGGCIAHVDLTIICEAPKIGPHREAMRASLGHILGIGLDRVSIKATTTERLGFTGREEGIAANAVATILLREV